MSGYTFSAENLKEIDKLLKRYPSKEALTLPILWMVQNDLGYLSNIALREASKILDMPTSHFYSVASFYTMFKFKKSEKVFVELCKSLSCELNNSDELYEYLKSRDDIELVRVECLGSCGSSPMCAINGKYHENLNIKKLDTILGDKDAL